MLVEQSAGAASGWPDDAYIAAGAEIVPTVEECLHRADAVWKVMAPSAHECRLLRSGQRVLALGHAGPEGAWPRLPDGVIHVRLERHDAVRAAMSDIAGRLAVDVAGRALQAPEGGRGLLLGGVPGVEPARVAIVGAGVAGRSAAMVAVALGAAVRVLDTELVQLRALAREVPGCHTLLATDHAIERALADADVVIAAVRVPGHDISPRIAERAHLALMQPGAVVVDLSILDGGAFSTTPLTELGAPCADVDGIVHVGVVNLAGAVPRTASHALAQAALPHVLHQLAHA